MCAWEVPQPLSHSLPFPPRLRTHLHLLLQRVVLAVGLVLGLLQLGLAVGPGNNVAVRHHRGRWPLALAPTRQPFLRENALLGL